jgi:feruloyl esterase
MTLLTTFRTLFCIWLIAAPLAAATCDSLADLKLSGATITSAKTVAPGAFTPPGDSNPDSYKSLPAFCRVQGVISPSTDSHIQFEVWMPTAGWNGKYLGVGNGAFAGYFSYSEMAGAVKNGYAASSTDTGHTGNPLDGAWALGHREQILDFGYRAIHETADKSKRIVPAFYGGNPKHSYFSSCSTGGRQALMEAQRYPADYDGIIAGAPVNSMTHQMVGFVWDLQALDSDPDALIPMNKLKAIENAALTACDALDGVKDGIIGDPTKCHFDPSALLCKGVDSEECLTPSQVTALKKFYDGPRSSKGEQIYPGYPPGGETVFPARLSGGSPREFVLAFVSGFFANMVFQNTSWDYRAFRFDRDIKITDDTVAQTFNATDPNLKAFKDRGGKLLIFHGWNDMSIAPLNSVNYYKSVVAKMGAKQAAEFVELYMVPGMQHCSGGAGPDSFGAVPGSPQADSEHSMSVALERWVENGTTPGTIVAAKYEGDLIVRTRPLCAYPKVARYSGTGSADDAANFKCVDSK